MICFSKEFWLESITEDNNRFILHIQNICPGDTRNQGISSHVIDLLSNLYYNNNHIFVGNKMVDHSDVAGALPVGAAPTTSSFST